MGTRLVVALLAALLSAGCASTVVAVRDRGVRDELDGLAWRPAAAEDLPGLWRLRRIQGPAAAVLVDVSYWLDADGAFSGSALFGGSPPTYQVLAGTWTLAAGGQLSLGEDAAPATAEVFSEAGSARLFLRLTGEEGRLVFERPEAR